MEVVDNFFNTLVVYLTLLRSFLQNFVSGLNSKNLASSKVIRFVSSEAFQDTVGLIIQNILTIGDFARAFYRYLFPKPMKKLDSEIILVTGSASGIGKELCFQLVEAGAKTLVLWDLNKKDNDSVANDLRSLGVSVHAYHVDITDRQMVSETADKVRHDVGAVTMLVQNAGVAYISDFLMSKPEVLEKIIQVNLISHFWTLKAFLPDMVKEGKGHIVTSCSLLGIKGVMKGVAYCASKFGVRGYLEALESELRHLPSKPDIKFTTIYPFFVKTPMVKNLTVSYRIKPLFRELEVPEVVSKIVEGIRRETHKVDIPWYHRFFIAFEPFWPKESNDRITDYLVLDAKTVSDDNHISEEADKERIKDSKQWTTGDDLDTHKLLLGKSR